MTSRQALSTERVDALLRRVDVRHRPDPWFVDASQQALAGRVRAARARDASWLGRLRRDVALAVNPASSPGTWRAIRLAALVALLALALVAGIVVVGALHRPLVDGNGLLIASVKGQLEAIDPLSGARHPILPADVMADGVSRSPDGRTATFWTAVGGRSHLFAVGVDGENRRELATSMSMVWDPSIDTWSADSRYLATEVTLDGTARILIVDVETGVARAVTPAGIVAHNPLWSPDDRWVAFTPETSAGRGLSVIRPDGTDMHSVGGDLRGLDVSGPDTWSPDGEWIYFIAADAIGPHVFRVNIPAGSHQQLTGDDLVTGAVASSPDGAKLAFIVSAPYGWDLWVADSDGRAAHRILETAGLGGWSSDGTNILVRWKPPDNKLGGLGTVRPDGTGLTILVPFDGACRHGWDETCVSGFGWGVARP
jgi:WD40 repeat protein